MLKAAEAVSLGTLTLVQNVMIAVLSYRMDNVCVLQAKILTRAHFHVLIIRLQQLKEIQRQAQANVMFQDAKHVQAPIQKGVFLVLIGFGLILLTVNVNVGGQNMRELMIKESVSTVLWMVVLLAWQENIMSVYCVKILWLLLKTDNVSVLQGIQ